MGTRTENGENQMIKKEHIDQLIKMNEFNLAMQHAGRGRPYKEDFFEAEEKRNQTRPTFLQLLYQELERQLSAQPGGRLQRYWEEWMIINPFWGRSQRHGII